MVEVQVNVFSVFSPLKIKRMVLKINGDFILFSLHVNSQTTAPTDKVSSLVGTLFNYLVSFNIKI